MRRAFCLLSLVTAGAVAADEVSELTVEAYGDSLTAGFLSYSDVTTAPPLEEMGRIVSDLFAYLTFNDKTKLPRHHSPQLAWPRQLGDLLTARGEKVKVSNFAHSGDKVADLARQVARSGTAGPAAAFFFIGHNDMCKDELSPEALAEHFTKQYQRALADWDARHEGAAAYLMPIGDINRVFEVLKGYVWHRGREGNLSCETSWLRYFPYCPSHAKRLRDNTLGEFLKPRREAVNRAIRTIAATQRSRRNRYVYLEDVLSRAYEPAYFAIDCYHLSARGQREVADDVFRSL